MTWRTRRWLAVAMGGLAKGMTGPWGSAAFCLLPCVTWGRTGIAWGGLQRGCKHISRSVGHACSYLLALPAGTLGNLEQGESTEEASRVLRTMPQAKWGRRGGRRRKLIRSICSTDGSEQRGLEGPLPSPHFQRVELCQVANHQLTHLYARQRKHILPFFSAPTFPELWCGNGHTEPGWGPWYKATPEGSAPRGPHPCPSSSSQLCSSKQLWAFPYPRAPNSLPRADAKRKVCREARRRRGEAGAAPVSLHLLPQGGRTTVHFTLNHLQCLRHTTNCCAHVPLGGRTPPGRNVAASPAISFCYLLSAGVMFSGK